MSDAPHQLDRIEDMLTRLVDAHPGLDDNKIHKRDVQRLVVDMVSYIIRDEKIGAIRNYRALSGYGLKECKDAIEAIMSRMTRDA